MTVLHNASIRTKLAAVFGTALMLVVAVGLSGLLLLRAVHNVAQEVRDVWLPRLELLGDMKRAASEHHLLATRRTQTTNFHHLASIAAGMRQTQQLLSEAGDAYQRSLPSSEERASLDEFRQIWSDYEDTLATVLQKIESGEISIAVIEFNTTSAAAFERAVSKLERLISFSKQESYHATARAGGVYQLAQLFTVILITAAAAYAFSAIAWTTTSISSPILRISAAMRRLTAGDDAVTFTEGLERQDEIGTLAAAVAGYRDSLIRMRQLSETAERERQRLQAAVSNMPIGLAMFDAQQQLIICNSRYGEIYDLPAELLQPGVTLRQMLEHRFKSGALPVADPEAHYHDIVQGLRSKEPTQRLLALSNGRIVSVIQQPMEGAGWLATHEDVTERRRAEEQIHHMARHDALTDLPNRVLFKEQLGSELKRLPRGETVAVLCLDLDRFKSVNDTLGHPAGDLLLKIVADRLRSCVREFDMVARFGGDEFAIVQLKAAQPAGATALADRMIEALSAPYDLAGHQVVIGVSVGIAIAPGDGMDADVLLKNGDMALYRAKSDGRGTYRLFEAEMDARMQARRALELDLRRGLLHNEFDVYYQPVINLHSNRVTGFEALLRWRHPERGIVSPDEFIPLAEEIGLIVPIGAFVLRRACMVAATWPRDLGVAVNFSPVQFKSKNLLETVINALAVSKLAPHRLEVEITEGVLLNDTESTLATLHQLRALGVRIAMDDFGTGYSSLSYLRSFPFDRIKIDRSFISNVKDQNSSTAIIRAVTGLSASLGMVTTAEGVETKEQHERVRAEGCAEVQGFLFSPPRPESEISQMLAQLPRQIRDAA